MGEWKGFLNISKYKYLILYHRQEKKLARELVPSPKKTSSGRSEEGKLRGNSGQSMENFLQLPLEGGTMCSLAEKSKLLSLRHPRCPSNYCAGWRN